MYTYIYKTLKNSLPRAERASILRLSSRKNVTEAKFQVEPFQLHKLEFSPHDEVTINKEEALKLFKEMRTIRKFETAAASLYTQKLIRGFCHLFAGQEACAVGMRAAMRSTDSIITSYRSHGWAYLMGGDAVAVMSELTGRHSGCSRGKGGSMHMYGPNFYGGNGIVGSQIPLGTGIAFAAKYLDTGGICLVIYGDGAANQGQVFEAFNIAKLWNLPCVYVCENNGYGMGTSAERASASTAYYTRGDFIPGIKLNGMDVLAVKSATEFAIEHVTHGEGPIILEVVTYRYYGHSMSDPGTSYRSREEIKEMRENRDPITSFRERLLSSGLASVDDLKKLEQEISLEVDVSVNIALEDKEIGLDELTADVYAEAAEEKIRGISPWDDHTHKTIRKTLSES